MEHEMKQIAKPVGVTIQDDGTTALRVRSTIYDKDSPIARRYPPEWDLSKELLEITDKSHIMARLGLTEDEYGYWMGQLE